MLDNVCLSEWSLWSSSCKNICAIPNAVLVGHALISAHEIRLTAMHQILCEALRSLEIVLGWPENHQPSLVRRRDHLFEIGIRIDVLNNELLDGNVCAKPGTLHAHKSWITPLRSHNESCSSP